MSFVGPCLLARRLSGASTEPDFNSTEQIRREHTELSSIDQDRIEAMSARYLRQKQRALYIVLNPFHENIVKQFQVIGHELFLSFENLRQKLGVAFRYRGG